MTSLNVKIVSAAIDHQLQQLQQLDEKEARFSTPVTHKRLLTLTFGLDGKCEITNVLEHQILSA